MAIPTLDLGRAPPGKLTLPNIVGGAVEGGRSQSGLVSAADMTGGGLVAVKYKAVALGNSNPARLRYWSQLGAILNGGVRSILVPLLTDFIAPQGSTMVLAADAALNAGTIAVKMINTFLTSDMLTGGEWLGIVHQTRSARAYCVTEVDAVVDNGDGSTTYTVGIRPPLREATAANTGVNPNRPLCLMRLEPGTTITADVEDFWWATPDASFIESFGTV